MKAQATTCVGLSLPAPQDDPNHPAGGDSFRFETLPAAGSRAWCGWAILVAIGNLATVLASAIGRRGSGSTVAFSRSVGLPEIPCLRNTAITSSVFTKTGAASP